MISTAADVLAMGRNAYINKPNLIEKCNSCRKTRNQNPRIPPEERFLLGSLPNTCSDCYETAEKSYTASHIEGNVGLKGIFNAGIPEN